MTLVPVARAKNIKNAAEQQAKNKNYSTKGVDSMLEFDESRLTLAGMEQDINDLRDSL